MLDIASPKRSYTVANFKRDAQKAIRHITRRGKLPIICGGTGFWIDALIYNQSIPEVAPDPKLRAELQNHTPEELYRRLKRLDPARAATIDRHNPVRLIRALEIVLSTGKPVPARADTTPYDALYLVLNPNPATLHERITKRLDARLRAGMVAEVKRLHSQGVSYKRLEALGLEYRWVAQFLQGKVTRTAMRDGLLRDIVRYSKRQLTWWKRNKNIHWITTHNEGD
jgi:tRNA dimethylallyltransferase